MYTQEDFSFLQVAIYLGLLTPKEGKKVLEERGRLFRQGQDLSLSRLLLKLRRLEASQIGKIEEWMRDGYFYCTHCKALYPPSRSVAPRQACSRCKRPLQKQEKMIGSREKDLLFSMKEDLSPGGNGMPREVSVGGSRSYPILKTLGKGGFGEVYEVQDPFSGRALALKTLLPKRREDRNIQKRFKREIQITSLLQHPNIMPVYESGYLKNGSLYYVMKELKGGTLQDLITGVQLGVVKHPLGDLLEIVMKVCDALSYAHSRGVVHRDLKPSNIAVGDFGEVIVLDWGIALCKAVEELQEEDGDLPLEDLREQLTKKGMALGTAGYMAPEQARGENVDGRSDLFSLGAILYEILTGEKAFPGKNPQERLMNSLMRPVTPPHSRRKEIEIPPALSVIVLKALEKNRENRYGSAQELKEEIGRFLEPKEGAEEKKAEPIPVRKPLGGPLLFSLGMALGVVMGAVMGWRMAGGW